MDSPYKKTIISMFDDAGITVDGNHPYDIQVQDERFYKCFLRDGRLGIGESYMDGWWDCEDLDVFIHKLIMAQQMMRMHTRSMDFLGSMVLSKIMPYGSRRRSGHIGKAHYDAGNDLYRAMLDKRMVYTCAYWEGAKDLDQAQEQKLEMVCRKLMLKPGMRILDVGCGWGSSLSKKYGEGFYRMWKFYLLSMAAGFKARVAQVWQIVLTRRGLDGGYLPAHQLRS